MNMFDEARALKGMINMCGMTQEEIAKKMGVSQSYVGNKLRLLKFSESAQVTILEAGLTERHARTLLRIADSEVLFEAITKIKERGLNVADSEALVDVFVEAKAPTFLGKAAERERIERFESFIASSVASLISIGINARRETSYYGNKRYITICIEEN